MPFAGSLGTLPMPDILNTLHNIHASGVLRLVSRVGSRDVVFQGGEIIGVGLLDQEKSEALTRRLALLSQGGVELSAPSEEARQEDALSQVFNLFAWNDATFAFSPVGAEEPDIQQLLAICLMRPLSLNIQHVLMEAARQQDEWAALRARIQQESTGLGVSETGTTNASAAPPPDQDLAVEVDDDGGSAAPDPVIAPAPRAEDQEWQKPILSDEELAPTPWDGRSPTGSHARPQDGAITTTASSPAPSLPAASPPTTTVSGVTVGPYRLSATPELLNGSAYRGRHVQERTEVAIRLVPQELLGGEQGLHEALHQARLLAAVHHPSLIICHGAGLGGGGIYAAFAARPGDDLAQVVERSGGPLTEAAVLRIALDAAFALQALHHRALVHRDLRPDSLFVGNDGRAILGPFALVDAPPAAAAAPERGRLVAELGPCTPPEVVQGVMDVDHRADVYALGCVLYFLATGQPPYHGTNRQELARAMQSRPVPRIREINRHISEGLDAVVAAAMAKERAQRPPSIDALIADLQVLDVSQMPGGSLAADDDDSASTYLAISTGTLVSGQPMTRRQASSSSTRIVTATMGAAGASTTGGINRRSSTRITAVMPTSSDSGRRAVVPQMQPITSILMAQPPPESAPVPARSWGIYDLALVALVAATVFWVVTAPSSTPAAASPPMATAVGARPRLPEDGHRLRFSQDPWADLRRDGQVVVGPQGAVFTGAGALQASGQELAQALMAADDFTIVVVFTAGRIDHGGEGRLLALAHSPVIANCTLGQVGSGLVARLRTSGGDATGTPITTPRGIVTGQRQRLAFVHARARATLYLDGLAVGWATMPGDLSTWSAGSPLFLGADPQGRSPWSGIIHEVVFWPRALTEPQIAGLDRATNPTAEP